MQLSWAPVGDFIDEEQSFSRGQQACEAVKYKLKEISDTIEKNGGREMVTKPAESFNNVRMENIHPRRILCVQFEVYDPLKEIQPNILGQVWGQFFGEL